jgi:lipopolysaccharide biosynthesis glycosyltransferase
MRPIPVFIGYDGDAEPVAYHVCADSIIRNASHPVAIIPLALPLLRAAYTERHTDGSNAFIYSRFLVPFLMDFAQTAVFLDGDMLVRGDIAELVREHWRNGSPPVSVVKHEPYETKQSVKYLGAKNESYPRKNWSSVIVWNCAAKQNACLTTALVENSSGAYLHRFQWLQDDEIGSLPSAWNRLVIEQEVKPTDKLLHYTLGTPCFADYAHCPHADEWYEAMSKAISHLEPGWTPSAR